MSPFAQIHPAMKSQGYLAALHECGFRPELRSGKMLLAVVSFGFYGPI